MPAENNQRSLLHFYAEFSDLDPFHVGRIIEVPNNLQFILLGNWLLTVHAD